MSFYFIFSHIFNNNEEENKKSDAVRIKILSRFRKLKRFSETFFFRRRSSKKQKKHE